MGTEDNILEYETNISWHEYFYCLYMRKPRSISAGAAYHVCARANRQEMILENDDFKRLFLSVLKEAKQKYAFRLRNFCIMGNHVHLDIEPSEGASLSKIMQWILSVFAIRYNKLFNYKGHVWYDRFKSKVIQTIQHLIYTFLYIATNPVRAGLVAHPLEFKFNGVYFHKNKDHPDNILEELDGSLQRIVDDFLRKFDGFVCPMKSSDISFVSQKPGRRRRTE